MKSDGELEDVWSKCIRNPGGTNHWEEVFEFYEVWLARHKNAVVHPPSVLETGGSAETAG